jgi:SAM-dependent methyltransferase
LGQTKDCVRYNLQSPVSDRGSERRLLFGEVAELYDRVRPGYPSELIDDVLSVAAVGSDGRALEVGAGTGRATSLFAARDIEVVCLEPSAEMAQVARRNCSRFPRVKVIDSSFEEWDLQGTRFKLLFSAQAWHWVRAEVRYSRAHAALEQRGVLALFWNYPVWKGSPVRAALDEVYERRAPHLQSGGSGFATSGTHRNENDQAGEIERSGLFGDVEVRHYQWSETYDTHRYIALLSTHSDHRTLGDGELRNLLDGVREVIDGSGGALTLDYVTNLYLARRLN